MNIKRVVDNITKDFKDITSKLLLHYHKLLLEGLDTRSEGLTWVIKAIWSLGSNVIMSYLPTFLDELAIRFLFKVSREYKYKFL